MMKRVDVAVYETIKATVNGKYKPGVQEFGLKENGVGYAVNKFNKAQNASLAKARATPEGYYRRQDQSSLDKS
jgi:basic membrane protein A